MMVGTPVQKTAWMKSRTTATDVLKSSSRLAGVPTARVDWATEWDTSQAEGALSAG